MVNRLQLLKTKMAIRRSLLKLKRMCGDWIDIDGKGDTIHIVKCYRNGIDWHFSWITDHFVGYVLSDQTARISLY
jgi:hypothetical protein